VAVPTERRESTLLCRVRGHLCAVPLVHVVETMRPLALEPFGEMPTFVLGLSLIRGDAVPVVDPGVLLGFLEPAKATRFVLLRTSHRRVALAVESVVGVRDLSHTTLRELPPLMGPANAQLVAALSTLDAELLLVLDGSRILPDAAWNALSAGKEPP
jgi:purine-binding chemotaxis protein CheW